MYIKAAMEVLAIQHPPISKSKAPQKQHRGVAPLTIAAEKALMASIMHIVKPEKKPLDGKIILRRAPTQEEFFRGNHSKDLISFSMLKSTSSGNNKEEPTVRDLRQHVATDLQMEDSAELLEVLVANKILDVDLKLRVVLQTIWKDHLMQHSGGSSSSTSLSSLLLLVDVVGEADHFSLRALVYRSCYIQVWNDPWEELRSAPLKVRRLTHFL